VKAELTKLDEYFFKLAQNLEIDLMPGENDPSNALFPQQAFNPCYFPKCYRKSNLLCKTNPYNFV
jgi:DNA polymerase delta subunit 2